MTHTRQTHRWDECYTDRRVKHRSLSLSLQNTLFLSDSLSCVCSLQTQDILAAHRCKLTGNKTQSQSMTKVHLILSQLAHYLVFSVLVIFIPKISQRCVGASESQVCLLTSH